MRQIPRDSKPLTDSSHDAELGIDQRWVVSALLIYIAAVAVGVFSPQAENSIDSAGFRLALASGWFSDALRNVLLFLPIGALLKSMGIGRSKCLLIGFAMSCSIELLQIPISGRIASPIDVAANTLGTVLGIALPQLGRSLYRSSSRTARRLSLGAAVLSACMLIITSWLTTSAFPASTYYGSWTPDFPSLEQYRGQVLDAKIGGISIVASGPQPESGRLRESLSSNHSIQVKAIAGAPPDSLAPLLTLADKIPRQILFIGIEGFDLYYEHRTHAARLGFDNPQIRLDQALAFLQPGDPFTIRISRSPGVHSLAIDNGPAWPLNPSASRGWAILSAAPHAPSALLRVFDTIWLGMLLAPAAYWARRAVVAWTAVGGLVALIAILPRFGPLRASSWTDWGLILSCILVATLAAAWRRIPHARSSL